MSNLPEMNLENYEYLCSNIDPLEFESWPPFLQYIEEPAATTQYSIAENAFNSCEPPAVVTAPENGGGYKVCMNSNVFAEQEHLAPPPPPPPPPLPQVEQSQPRVKGKGLINRRNKGNYNNSKTRKCLKNKKILVGEQSADGERTSFAKKLNHNAKERIRRMKVNASYLALRALIPDYSKSRSKKRWTAPVLVDRVLKYIPELENEIESLKLKKQNYQIQSEENTSINSLDENSLQTGIDSTTISVNEVKEGEAIIQICMENSNAFTKLLQKVEDEPCILIQSASTLHVSQNRMCYHLHIQTSENSTGVNYVEGLRDKVISWLR